MNWLNKCALFGLVFVLIAGCGREEAKEKNPTAPMVKAITVGNKDGAQPRSYPGRVKANREVELAFQVSGQITNLPIVVGEPVQEGQLLASLDPRDFQNNLNVEMAELNKSKQQYERTLELVTKGTISQADHDKTTAAFEVAKARVALAQKALDDTQLKAPFSGRVATKYVENFQNIQAKEPILSLQDIAYVDIEFSVPEKDFIKAKANPDARTKARNKVIIDALPDREFWVVLKDFETQAQEETQTFLITVTMQAPKDVMILPGMSATFLYLDGVRQAAKAVSIPIECIGINKSGQHFVWVIDSDLKVKRQIIEVGQPLENNIEILSGLDVGAQIVAAGIDKLEEGMQIRIWQQQKD